MPKCSDSNTIDSGDNQSGNNTVTSVPVLCVAPVLQCASQALRLDIFPLLYIADMEHNANINSLTVTQSVAEWPEYCVCCDEVSFLFTLVQLIACLE